MVQDNSSGQGRARRRRAAALIHVVTALAFAAGSGCSSESSSSNVDELVADPRHREARREVLASIEMAERWGGPEDLAEIRDLRTAGNFDEFPAACGYRVKDGDVERVIVVGSGVLYEDAIGGKDVFRNIDAWVGCPEPSLQKR